MANKTGADAASSVNNLLARQYVSAPLAAQTISGTVKCYLRALKSVGQTHKANMSIRVCNNAGSSFTGTLLALGDYAGGTQFNNTTLENKKFADGEALSSLAVNAGDRLVIELGSLSAASSDGHGTLSFGDDSGTDLPENETTTAANNPWIEFSGTLVFATSATLTPATGSLVATGVTPSRIVGSRLTPPSGSLAAAGIAGSMRLGTVLRPNAGSVTLSGLTPVLRTDFFLTPAPGGLTLVGRQSALSNSEMPMLTPGTGALTVSGVAPVAVRDTRLMPTVGALTLVGKTPVRVIGAFLSPLTGALTLAGQQAGMENSSLMESLAPVFTRYAPRPLLTLTIGAETKRYSSTDVYVSSQEGVGVAQVGESQVGE